MATRILRSGQSRSDLVDIIRYLRSNSRRGARQVHDAIDRTLEFLAQNPGAGPSRDELLPGLHSYPTIRYPHYVLFYQPLRDGILLVRVLHGARDLPRQFPHA